MAQDFREEARKEAISLAQEAKVSGEDVSSNALLVIDPRGDEGPVIEVLIGDEHSVAESRKLAADLRLEALTTMGDMTLFSTWRSTAAMTTLMSKHGASQHFVEWLSTPVSDGYVRLVMLDSSGHVSFETLPYTAVIADA